MLGSPLVVALAIFHERAAPIDILHLPAPRPEARVPYGSEASQFGDLRLPQNHGLHPVAIVIHGGFWRAKYGLEHIGHLCAALAGAGLATWSLEYRRTGDADGGWPGTCEDVAQGANYLQTLAEKYPLDLRSVVVVGHSAGGHLALWLATQRRIVLRGVVSLAGVADLRRAWELHLGNDAVAAFLAGSPQEVPERYQLASPIQMLPLGVPQCLLHGTSDDVVPFEISERYAKTARAAGDKVELMPLVGAGHFELIDPRSQPWPQVQRAIIGLI